MDAESFVPDKSKFKDKMGRYLTQSLFLEYQYDHEVAIYTLKDNDYEFEGKMFPSLRKLYLEMMDPTEYEFANKYLWGWEHWQRIVENKQMFAHIQRWQEELEVKIRAQAVKRMLNLDGNFNAVKWAADGHWNVRRGRPTKAERERERKIRDRAVEETMDDASRIAHLVPKKPQES